MYAYKRIEPQALFSPVRQSLTGRLAGNAPLVAALDDTRLRKNGRKTHGVKYTRDPLSPAFHVNFIKAQRFVQLSMACAADNGMARMIPIDFVHAPAPQKPGRDADAHACEQFRKAQRERASTQSLLQHLRHEVWAEALHFSGFVSNPPDNTKPQNLHDTLKSALFYAVA